MTLWQIVQTASMWLALLVAGGIFVGETRSDMRALKAEIAQLRYDLHELSGDRPAQYRNQNHIIE